MNLNNILKGKLVYIKGCFNSQLQKLNIIIKNRRVELIVSFSILQVFFLKSDKYWRRYMRARTQTFRFRAWVRERERKVRWTYLQHRSISLQARGLSFLAFISLARFSRFSASCASFRQRSKSSLALSVSLAKVNHRSTSSSNFTLVGSSPKNSATWVKEKQGYMV